MTTAIKQPDALLVAHPITKQRISDLLCSAFEGGSNYWYIITANIKPAKLTFRTDPDHIYPHLDYPLNDDGALMIGDLEDDSRPPIRLDLDAIGKGLALMARTQPRHFGDFLAENDDASTADVFLQLCLFGEVIYG